MESTAVKFTDGSDANAEKSFLRIFIQLISTKMNGFFQDARHVIQR